MNAQEAIIEVYEGIGEPSDLPIYTAGGVFDIAAEGSVRILAALNRAQDYVSTFKRTHISQSYFRCMEASATFEPVVVSEVLGTQVAPYKTIYLPATMSASAAGRFEGWVYDDGVDVRRVLRHGVVGGIGYVVLDAALDATPAARTLSLRQKRFTLGTAVDDVQTARRPIEVVRIFDLATQSELERAEANVRESSFVASVGTPGTYLKRSRGFVFDCAVDDARSYEVEFYAYPEEAVAATDEFALPDAFHDAIVLRATWWGFSRYMETTAAYAKKKDFTDLMVTLQDEIEIEDMHGGDSIRPIMM